MTRDPPADTTSAAKRSSCLGGMVVIVGPVELTAVLVV
jgi:hypothetical protein